MRLVTPRVFLIAETRLVPSDLSANTFSEYLAAVGAPGWETNAPSEAEELVEVGGRLCYRSWAAGLNPNVTKVREGNQTYLQNILVQAHGSVLEHASVTFIFHNVSRVFTHELVRHRAGCAMSQESMRYVRLNNIPFFMPEALAEPTYVRKLVQDVIEHAEEVQSKLAEFYGLDDESSFTTKKHITSAMRRVVPDGVATSIMWTANMRSLRHVLALRTNKAAEEEIRRVFDEVGKIVKDRYPNLFQDFTRNEDGEWLPQNPKV